nr:Zgc:101711 [Danio rerio]
MSESSSDTESSCGWTVISNEGSDIETLGPDNAGECEDGVVSLPSHVPDATQVEESLGEPSLNLTLRAEATSEPVREAEAGAEEHVILCSSSDYSDIITLGDAREAETEEEPVVKKTEEAGSEDLGSSSSSQYTFRESEKIFPVDPPAQRDDSNSSTEDDDDDETKASPVLRRRRVRRSSESGDPQEKHRRAEEVLICLFSFGLVFIRGRHSGMNRLLFQQLFPHTHTHTFTRTHIHTHLLTADQTITFNWPLNFFFPKLYTMQI